MPLLHKVQTGSGAQPGSYPLGSAFFTEVKRPGRNHHPHSFTAEVKNEWNYRLTCLHGADRDFTFHLYRGNFIFVQAALREGRPRSAPAVPLHRQSGSTRFSSKPWTLLLYHHSLKIKVLEMTSFGAETSVTSNKHLSTARIIYIR